MFDDDGRDEILESPITLCCEGDVLGCQYSLGLLSMSRSTRNCWDAMLPWPSTSLASSAGSSTSTAAPTTMSFPPSLVQQIVDAVKAH